MPRKNKTTTPVEITPQEQAAPNDSLSKRVRKHVSDKNDMITDEDIRNVKVDVLPKNFVDNSEPGSEQLPGETTKGHPKHITPWDIVSDSP